ncbi:molecular chaperone DnaK [Helicobacter ailurogastricus]|uniref:molecular chaperone DnaK n=1 Tax=Helicobacter ailurogastricus TaxID=1578720 RepID=UPI00255520CD|nr:molecular chaperone DnaK [Helicobacter ailurogastricus]
MMAWVAKMRGSVVLLAVLGIVIWVTEKIAPGMLKSFLGFVWDFCLGLVCFGIVFGLCWAEGVLWYRLIQRWGSPFFTRVFKEERFFWLKNRLIAWVVGVLVFAIAVSATSEGLYFLSYCAFLWMGYSIFVFLTTNNNAAFRDKVRAVYQNAWQDILDKNTQASRYLSHVSLLLTSILAGIMVLGVLWAIFGSLILFALQIILFVSVVWLVYLFVKIRLDSKKSIKSVQGLTMPQEWAQDYINALLQADRVRADITPYDSKILSDANRGSWELWDLAESLSVSRATFVRFEKPLIARNPKADIKEGLVGIDFGTTSSVVVCQEENQSVPMRVGLGDLTQEIEKNHYENPTILSFNDLASFLQAYKSQRGRPPTKWDQVQVSHAAYSAFLGSPSSDYNAYLSGLKQWAGDKQRKLQILDKQGAHFEIKESLAIKEGDLNPIELYAYYLGLYINNQHHGVFLNYLLSFPVTYDSAVRNMILESFKRGLAKSLPNTLHSQKVVEQLKVEEGASEPAAYAIIALENYNFDPSENERVYYGVFDFGGGTTDFDFGVLQGTPESSRYDYELEHFGGAGDRFLGGEHLLELASFEIFKRNHALLLSRQIPFKKPAEGQGTLGIETLLNDSAEAHTNTKTLMEKLRPLWEGREFEDEGVLSLNLFDSGGQNIAGVDLDFSTQEVQNLFKERIKRGVDLFFSEFWRATDAHFESVQEARDIDTFHIFLAGNASKSRLVQELFEAKINQITQDTQARYQVYLPLESPDLAKPNGKTGVAFGLIRTRKGGQIQVINNYTQGGAHSKYILGRGRKQKFEIVLERDQAYQEWVKFLDASESRFELYYTLQTNPYNCHLSDPAIKKKSLETGVSNPHAFIFIRLVSPGAFEFVVATDEGLADENYLSPIQKVEL